MSVALNKALNDKILATNLGKTRTGLEAIVQSIDRVLQSDSKGMVPLMNLFNRAKVFKPVPNPTRLTGVVVEPPPTGETKELGIQQGYYPVGNGLGFYVDQSQSRLAMTRQEIETNSEPKATDGKVGYKHPQSKVSFSRGNPAILAVVVKANAIWRPCWPRSSVRPSRSNKGEIPSA
jgi:hypothetical protein